MPRNYWMLVITPGNYIVTRDLGFTVQGLPTYLRRKTERMENGDRLLFYISEMQKFAATANVTSGYFEEHTPLWTSHRADEDFPFRVHIEPAVVIEDEEGFLDARQIGPRMEYVKKWIPEQWPLAFHSTMLHLIPRKDFSLIEEEMKRVANRKRKAKSVA